MLKAVLINPLTLWLQWLMQKIWLEHQYDHLSVGYMALAKNCCFGKFNAIYEATLLTDVTVTHNMQQAARVSDFTTYMYLGEMIEYGKTDEIFIKPKKQETEDYITGRFG